MKNETGDGVALTAAQETTSAGRETLMHNAFLALFCFYVSHESVVKAYYTTSFGVQYRDEKFSTMFRNASGYAE